MSLGLGVCACGEATSSPEGPTAGASTTGGSVNGGADGGGAGRGSGGSAAVSGSAGQTSGGDSDPVLCGGAYASECAAQKLCSFDSTCGTVGSCIRKPGSCGDLDQPTCGCDGKTYANECEARRAGMARQHEGACDETSQFACGPYRCEKGQYCVDKAADGDSVWRYACLTLPEACAGTASCECLGKVKACFTGHDCAVTGTGVTATCK
jgi:hypothetical protein